MCKVVILYFQYDLGKMLEEICYSKFWSFCCDLSMSEFANGDIYRALVLSVGVSIDTSIGSKYDYN